MADIELVIKVPEEEYKLLKDQKDKCNVAMISTDIITNGTLLPKGHGRLIDYSWVVKNVIKKLGIKDERYLLEAEKALMSIVNIAPTIIEADKEGDEEC